MKYGRVLTYKDAEEAKKLIGEKVVASHCLSKIEKHPEIIEPEILTGIDDELDFIFEIGDCYSLQFIREIIKEEKPQLMTNRQMMEWSARGYGESSYEGLQSVFLYHGYSKSKQNAPVPDNLRIRTWDSDEWVVPTVEIYERDCKRDSK